MKKILLPALLVLSVSVLAQNNEKPADASATKLNTVRTKEVTTGEVRTKNVTIAPATNAVDQSVSGRQNQNQTSQTRVKPAIAPSTSKVEGEK
ncbi:MAG: hypothetical protein AB7G44_09890 [Bacteroidia bacterium]